MHLKYKFEMMQLEDYLVAVPIGKGGQDFRGVIKLNESAAYIFDLLKEDITEAEILNKMEQVYDVQPSVLEQEIKLYIKKFDQKGLLA